MPRCRKAPTVVTSHSAGRLSRITWETALTRSNEIKNRTSAFARILTWRRTYSSILSGRAGG